MNEFKEQFILFLPLIILQFTLALVALVHVLKHDKYRFGNRIIWIFVVLFLQFIGPVVYFVFGREQE